MTEFILALLQKKDKLKLSTVYQVLIGKKTSSVLSYAFFHDLLPYLGSFPKLTEERWQQEVLALVEAKQVAIQEGYLYLTIIPTTPSFLLAPEYRGLNYFRFGKKDAIAWRLLQFFVQTITTPNKAAIPLETGPYYTQIVAHIMAKESQIVERTYTELLHVFNELPEEQSELLVATLSGASISGVTFYQVLSPNQTVKDYLYRAGAWHHVYTIILAHPEWVLYQVIKQPFFETLNHSVLVTRTMFLAQQTLNEIAKARQLKESTIRDHLIEWAILDAHFPYQYFEFSALADVMDHPEIFDLTYAEVQAQLDVDFLTYRLYQIKRKRECLNDSILTD